MLLPCPESFSERLECGRLIDYHMREYEETTAQKKIQIDVYDTEAESQIYPVNYRTRSKARRLAGRARLFKTYCYYFASAIRLNSLTAIPRTAAQSFAISFSLCPRGTAYANLLIIS